MSGADEVGWGESWWMFLTGYSSPDGGLEARVSTDCRRAVVAMCSRFQMAAQERESTWLSCLGEGPRGWSH